MTVKQCGKCGIVKDKTDFYRRGIKGGLDTRCKDCDKARRKNWRVTNNMLAKEKDMERYRQKKFEYPEKISARLAVNYAIRKGVLTRGPCGVCGSSEVEAHHCDYMKPLDISWLCKEHHALWHRHLKAYDSKHRPEDGEDMITAVAEV